MKIKSARQFAGLTQQQFADVFDISIDTVKAWDCGRRKPDKLKEKLILKELERMAKMIKWNQEKIKKSAKDFNNWQGKAVIMVDTSDGDVWTDVFSSDTDWKEYNSGTIFSLYNKDNLYGRNKNISAKAINELLNVCAYKYRSTYDMPEEVLAVLCRNSL